MLAVAWSNAESKVLFSSGQLNGEIERTISVRFGRTEVLQTGAIFVSLSAIDGVEWVLAVEQGADYRPLILGDGGPRAAIWPVAVTKIGSSDGPLPCAVGGRSRACLSSGAFTAIGGIPPTVSMKAASLAGPILSAFGPVDAVDTALGFAVNGGIAPVGLGDVRWAQLGQLIVRVESSKNYDSVLAVVTETIRSLTDPTVSIEDRRSERSLLQAALSQAYDSKRNQALGAAVGSGAVALAIAAVSVLLRRSDLGRRRVLGARRSDIAHLVVLRGVLSATPASACGTALGIWLGWCLEGVLPPADLAVAWACGLVSIAAMASLPVAVIAGFRDPIRVLRLP